MWLVIMGEAMTHILSNLIFLTNVQNMSRVIEKTTTNKQTNKKNKQTKKQNKTKQKKKKKKKKQQQKNKKNKKTTTTKNKNKNKNNNNKKQQQKNVIANSNSKSSGEPAHPEPMLFAIVSGKPWGTCPAERGYTLLLQTV